MARLILTGYCLAFIVCQAHAGFISRQSAHLQSFRLQPFAEMSTEENAVLSGGDAAQAGGWFNQRLAGEMLGDDFLLGPVSFMRPGRSGDRLTAFGPSSFDVHGRYSTENQVAYYGQGDAGEITVPQMPAPNSLLLLIAAIASLGWLRNRVTK